MRCSLKAFERHVWAHNEWCYIQPHYDGQKGQGRTLTSAIAVDATKAKTRCIGVWVRDVGIVYLHPSIPPRT